MSPGSHIRRATPGDVDGIAALHADSWRRNYRGAFPDTFLDGDLVAERRAVWTDRLAHPGPVDLTLVADDGTGAVVGLAHTVLDSHPEWGALLDNLHVRHGLKGQGLGRRLVAATVEAVVAHDPAAGLHVEVLAQNTPAQAFYVRLGATLAHTAEFDTPGAGRALAHVYTWPAPLALSP